MRGKKAKALRKITSNICQDIQPGGWLIVNGRNTRTYVSDSWRRTYQALKKSN